jgi:tetratricopeptide (TPR) repeat protein/transcriptional regulator with XRE-family HTH domain
MVAAMLTRRATLSAASFSDFGTLLRVLRRRARLTQRELGLAVGYSEAQISRLEQARRRPDPSVVAALFLPALRLGAEPELAARLHELAVLARSPDAGSDASETGPVEAADPAAGGRPDDAARAADAAALPPPPSHQVQRPAALALLRGRVAADRRVLLTGLPGTGKTSLAAVLAREQLTAGPVCWLTLTAGITTPAEAVIRLIARFLARHGHDEVAALCLAGPPERSVARDEQLYLITSALAGGGALICVDNAHLLRDEPGTSTVLEHIASAAPVSMLAVSREDLPLAGFVPVRLGGLAEAEARELVHGVAGPMISGQLASALIERTGGSPMLIRLALGQLHPAGSTATTLLEHLETEPGIAAFLLQATLRDLGEPSRRLLRLIAVFRHPVDLLDSRLIEASEALAGPYDVLAGLDELRRRQLIDHPARAELHPLVHDHVYAGLVGTAAGRQRLHRLAAAHCESVLADPLEASWHFARAGCPAEAAELLATRVADIIASGRGAVGAELAAGLLAAGGSTSEAQRQLHVARGDRLLHTELAAEAEDAYRRALASPASAAVRAEVSWRLAECLLQRGQVTEALQLCRSAGASLSDDDIVLRAQLAAMQGRAHLMLSELPAALAVAGEARAAAERFAGVAPDVAAAVRARAGLVLGSASRLRGEPREAVQWLQESLAAARAAGLREVAGRALFNTGAIAHELGEMSRAEQLYGEALAQMRAIADGYGIGRVLHALGMVRNQAGAPDEATALLEEARDLKLRMGDPVGAANSEHTLALIQLARGRTETARGMLATILAATLEHGERVSRAHYLDSLAMAELADADPASAGRHLAEAATIAAEVGHPSLGSMISLHRAFAALSAGELDTAGLLARDCAQEAAERDGAHASLGIELAALQACLALAAGQLPAARDHAAAMAALAQTAGDTRYRRAADRIASAVDAASTGGILVPQVLPRLLWVAAAG